MTSITGITSITRLKGGMYGKMFSNITPFAVYFALFYVPSMFLFCWIFCDK